MCNIKYTQSIQSGLLERLGFSNHVLFDECGKIEWTEHNMLVKNMHCIVKINENCHFKKNIPFIVTYSAS